MSARDAVYDAMSEQYERNGKLDRVVAEAALDAATEALRADPVAARSLLSDAMREDLLTCAKFTELAEDRYSGVRPSGERVLAWLRQETA